MGQEESTPTPPNTLTARSLPAVAAHITSGTTKRIIVLTGAGISTAAGIPDFRSPGTGLYANLARLNLPEAEAVFDIEYFRERPQPFYVLAKELYPGRFHPTVSHAFIALLAKKGMLHMLFTQNIDCLERRAGVPGDLVVEAHGSFATQRCVDCKTEYPDDKMKEHVHAGKVPRCEDKKCGGLVKPDIVFFGEPLPKRWEEKRWEIDNADLVLIIGTSLSVYPFAHLPETAPQGTPRVLFNMERVGRIGSRADDVLILGECDDGIRKLADELGWRGELEDLWKGVVGEKEARRQKLGSKKHHDEIEVEVEKLSAGVEMVLKLDAGSDQEDGRGGRGRLAADVDTQTPQSVESPRLDGSATARTTPSPDPVSLRTGEDVSGKEKDTEKSVL